MINNQIINCLGLSILTQWWADFLSADVASRVNINLTWSKFVFTWLTTAAQKSTHIYCIRMDSLFLWIVFVNNTIPLLKITQIFLFRKWANQSHSSDVFSKLQYSSVTSSFMVEDTNISIQFCVNLDVLYFDICCDVEYVQKGIRLKGNESRACWMSII